MPVILVAADLISLICSVVKVVPLFKAISPDYFWFLSAIPAPLTPVYAGVGRNISIYGAKENRSMILS